VIGAEAVLVHLELVLLGEEKMFDLADDVINLFIKANRRSFAVCSRPTNSSMVRSFIS
jgi:hypothetical protein